MQVAPHAYKVVLENDLVRVLESRMKPGETTEMHSHPDVVACAFRDGKFKFTSPDGDSMTIELKAGDAIFVGAVEHSTENVGDSEAHTLLVELK
ncbi:MAG: cupin domain-containing protein [Dehalococcoidia bacterium]